MPPQLRCLSERFTGDIGELRDPEVYIDRIESQDAPYPPTFEISHPSQRHSLRIPGPVGRGPAGTMSHGIQGSPGIWEEAMMRTAPSFQRETDQVGPQNFWRIFLVVAMLYLLFRRLIHRRGRSIRQIVDEMKPDPDAPWQATAEILQDESPSTFRADTSSRWEEDTHTLCGDEEAQDTLTLCEEDEDPGQAGMDFERVPASSSSGRVHERWRPLSPEEPSSSWA